MEKEACLLLQVPSSEPVFAKDTVYRIICASIVPFEGQAKVLKLLSAQCISQVHTDFSVACVQHAFLL